MSNLSRIPCAGGFGGGRIGYVEGRVMATPWCRLWADMPNDPKWRVIARASGQRIGDVISVYVHMMACATNATERNRTQPNATERNRTRANAIERGRMQSFVSEDIAAALDMSESDIEAIRAAMQGRVLDGDQLTGWDKRQPMKEDGAAERAKAWRLAKKEEGERKRTQTNANERPDSDSDSDSDINNKTLVPTKNPSALCAVEKKQKKFIKPTPDEVTAYCAARKNQVDPILWFDFYEAKGWLVGKTSMRDWKAAVRTWERGRSGEPPVSMSPSRPSLRRFL